jgi:SAM-dependent methyltransferase
MKAVNCEGMSIRAQYEKFSAPGYYARHGAEYRNPHEPIIAEVLKRAAAEWKLAPGKTLDLACGSGEATLVLQKLGFDVSGIDPYTGEAYRKRTGLAAEALTFAEIAEGALAGRTYDLIVCSFAMHLVAPSRLPKLLFRLREVSPALLIVTPHKRPKIEVVWRLAAEMMHERVRARLYL